MFDYRLMQSQKLFRNDSCYEVLPYCGDSVSSVWLRASLGVVT